MRRIYHQGERAPTVKVLLAARRLRSRPLIAYPIAFGLAGFFFALQYFDQQHFVGAPFLTLYPAVVAACFIAGTPAGLIIAALDGVMQWWLFIPTVQWLAVLTYTFDALLCVMVLDFLNRAFDLLLDLIEREKQSGRRHYLVSRELHHRIQNMFQVVQAVVRFSLPERKLIDSTLVRDRLLNRIQAISATNLMITDSEQSGVSLCQIVENEIKPFAGQVHLTCERDLMLGGHMAQNLSLILHELATNAAKHGALSAPEGSVVINLDWDQQCLTLRWHEHGGPPVAKPVEIGFGSRLLNQFAEGLGTVRADYDRSGLLYCLKIKSPDIWTAARTVVNNSSAVTGKDTAVGYSLALDNS